MKHLIFLTISFFYFLLHALVAEAATIKGRIISEGKAVEFANVYLLGTAKATTTDTSSRYVIQKIPAGQYRIRVTCVGFDKVEKLVQLKEEELLQLDFDLSNYSNNLNELVITGTLKELSRLESPVPVEVYKPTYFKKNPTPSIFEALQNVNGLRPQLNCNVCNTGDIHINGLEGPYTMVLIDGMPMVSSLSTVYGLSGIPNSLVERIEVVKGPASSLYGSEAVGGLINIITKKPQNAPAFSADLFSTTWLEHSVDLSAKSNVGKKASVLTGLNYFSFQNRVDNNQDNFTDMTLQDRVSVFQKWNFERKEHRIFTLAARYLQEDRWGGDLRWEKQFRGGDSIYGESIYTRRWEVLGNYQLPTTEKLLLSFSYTNHDQDSRYGTISYIAQQKIAFSQLTWDRQWGGNDILLGTALRYTFYDDNTAATSPTVGVKPLVQAQNSWLPGVFLQDEITLVSKHKLLLGLRSDYSPIHGPIFTPRLAYKWAINDKNILRFNAGTGFRVVNLFTEDHAALTGARVVELKSSLNPERSSNFNLNFIKKIYATNGTFLGLDASAFYTYFDNRIVGDYELDPNKIIYDNLQGYAESKGASINLDLVFKNGLKIITGGTLMENTLTEHGVSRQQLLTEKFTAVWAISYKIEQADLSIDYTGNLYSPMRLPLLGELDPRSATSPWWSIQNIQLLYSGFSNFEIYGGIKNLLNWTPNQGNPFIIARTNDPFDKKVDFDPNGKVLASSTNPYALTFDPNYVFGPNQGIRGFLGCRYHFK